MAVYLSPVGASTAPVANELRLLAVFKEKLCHAYCVDSTVQPQTNVTYNIGTARLVGTTIYVPVTATITVVTRANCCEARTAIFTENFVVAFQGYTALPTSVVVNNLGRDIQPSCVNCGRARGVTVNDSLNIVITPAATVGA